jgi:hypothetical protein
MSLQNAGRFSDAATLAKLVEQAIHIPPGEDSPLILDDPTSESALSPDSRPLPPLSTARVGPSRNAHSRSFNDPSNYLG